MNRTEVLVIACFAVVFVGVLGSPVTLTRMAVEKSIIMKAHAQTQTQEQKFFMIMKIRNPTAGGILASGKGYQVYNMTTNIDKIPSITDNKKIEFSKDLTVDISDSAIYWNIPYTIVDTSTPDIIKTKTSHIGTSDTQNFTKEFNTKTHVTKYEGQGFLIRDYDKSLPISFNITATIYPNDTGIVETKQH
jgi:hypothetical protein